MILNGEQREKERIEVAEMLRVATATANDPVLCPAERVAAVHLAFELRQIYDDIMQGLEVDLAATKPG